MAEPKKIKTRIINKHATAAVWEATQEKFTPLEGELIVYDKDDTYSAPRLKIGTGSKDVNELNFISEGMVDGTSLTTSKTSGKISLNQEYIDYLDSKLYAYPTISTFNIVGSNVEVGKTITISSFTHKETNSKNIKEGSLILTSNKNPEINVSIEPSDTQKTVQFSDSYTFAEKTTLTYTLKGEDTRGNKFNLTDSVSSYFPSFIGASGNSSITSVDGLTKVASSSLAGTRTIAASTQYVYFVTTTPIKSIKSGGFDVVYSQQDDIEWPIDEDKSQTYYVYRTDNRILSTMTYVIA